MVWEQILVFGTQKSDSCNEISIHWWVGEMDFPITPLMTYALVLYKFESFFFHQSYNRESLNFFWNLFTFVKLIYHLKIWYINKSLKLHAIALKLFAFPFHFFVNLIYFLIKNKNLVMCRTRVQNSTFWANVKVN